MKKEDLIEVDGVQYLVYEEKEIKGETYYLLCPVDGEKVIEDNILIVTESDGELFPLDENEDKEIFTELLDYFKKETGVF